MKAILGRMAWHRKKNFRRLSKIRKKERCVLVPQIKNGKTFPHLRVFI